MTCDNSMWHEIYNTAVSTCKKFRGASWSYIRKQKANVILFETGLCLHIRLTVILNLIHSAILPTSIRLSFFPEGGVGWVRSKCGCLLFLLAYYAFPRWYEFGEWRSNGILTGENRRTQRKTCPSATLSTTNLTWIDPGANPGLHSERLATNDLSHGMAKTVFYFHFIKNC
jgi:hypothetical protein